MREGEFIHTIREQIADHIRADILSGQLSEGEQLPWDVDEAELVDIKERAKDKTSFAEMFSAEVKEEDEEGDEKDKEKK